MGDLSVSTPVGLQFPDATNGMNGIGCPVPFSFWDHLVNVLSDANENVPGAPQTVHDLTDPHIAAVVSTYQQTNGIDSSITLTPVSATRQVVNGLIYAVHSEGSDGNTHHASVYMQSGTSSVLSSSVTPTRNIGLIVGTVLGGVAVLGLMVAILMVVRRRKMMARGLASANHSEQGLGEELLSVNGIGSENHVDRDENA